MTIRHKPNPQIPASFQRFYLSFQAQKDGYLQGYRPFIGLDGCHLKSPYEGILLCSIAIDANCGVYLITLGVVETESLDSWRWFLEFLYRHVGVYESREVCFMTDCQKGTIPTLAEVWPNYNSRFCGRHILQNMMSRFKVDYLTIQFWHAANSSNLPEFLEAMEAIKATSEAAHLYLTRIPLESWTIHKFDTICKTDHNTNSVVEAFNSWLNKFRTLPMLTLMEKVRQKIMK
ncbi:hypothetical protein Ddye_014304 [Dipteronia dyeriana]|uniref:MULE transposase domain-containing protein n=1 Tax=Dipteronia dyeriana TaxID=168575 RepID=A0AAE0CL17_9ROSI|nr:hypothetical protein Ddye_014304 [Dipteronia dyeriana]